MAKISSWIGIGVISEKLVRRFGFTGRLEGSGEIKNVCMIISN